MLLFGALLILLSLHFAIIDMYPAERISSTSFEIYKLHKFLIDVFECLYVHWFTCYFKALYQYLYHYIIFWYIYECVMTNGGEMCILLEM